MRGLRSTIALLVVLIGLSAYIYFVTSKAPDSTTVAAKERVYPKLDANGIVEIVVKADSGDTTTLKKDNGVWQLTAPVSTKAEEMEVTQLTSNLSTLDISRVVDEKPTDLNQYGLQTPRIEIDFKSTGDKDYHRLYLGEKSPAGGDLFARSDANPRVILVAGYTDTIFNRTTFDLRDKILVRFERDKVDRIEMSSEGKTLEFAKSADNVWSITKPVMLPGDYGSIDGLLGRIQTAAVKSVVSENAGPADLKKFGLDKPQGTLTLSAGGVPQTIAIGGKVDDNTVYVRDLSKPTVGGIDVSFLKELQKTVDDYRRRDLFAFKAFNADRLEVVRDGQSFVFEKVKNKDTTPDKWHRVSPNPGDPNDANMESLIAKIENLRAASFVDSTAKTGLDKPTASIIVKFDDDKQEDRVAFSKTGTDVYASITGQPGAAKVTTTEFDAALKALDEVSK
jgi:Domain of unknown function (DUF4340)